MKKWMAVWLIWLSITKMSNLSFRIQPQNSWETVRQSRPEARGGLSRGRQRSPEAMWKWPYSDRGHIQHHEIFFFVLMLITTLPLVFYLESENLKLFIFFQKNDKPGKCHEKNSKMPAPLSAGRIPSLPCCLFSR